MEYYAHKDNNNRKQTIKEHHENVAELACAFSIDLLKPFAHEIGGSHDLGKYAQAFQERLDGSSVKFEHSTCGAIEYSRLPMNREEQCVVPMMEYCVAGHHTGLPDGGAKNGNAFDGVTLQSRLGRASQYTGKNDYHAYQRELSLSIPNAGALLAELMKRQNLPDMIEKYAFFTRYLFSCLTDADYLDTEQFCSSSGIQRSLHANFAEVEKAVDRRFSEFTADTPLKAARGRLQQQAYFNAEHSGNISILNMPTGSGKTLCSLKIALQKLRNSNGRKKRIIYVIPYTSIIEQTAQVFENIFGAHTDILQHHSNYCFDSAPLEADTAQKLKLASENWDAPLIITTSVRFFESLYHYKSSGLRKLHNMADSIIIFDEIHLLPLNMLQPCLRGIGYITEYLNSEAILLSATMPNYEELFQKYLPECNVTQLLPDRSDFQCFKKCHYIDLGRTDYDAVLEKASHYQSSLIIVNKRKTAHELYERIQGEKYHLSTYMTPLDRSNTIAAIRDALEAERAITVVSTSLIEAGVDFDFKAVFRQYAGLDSILQSGGRCNREGKTDFGDVYIFETDEPVNRDLQIPVNVVKGLLQEYEDISSKECIEEYYRRLFHEAKELIEGNSIAKMCRSIESIPFRTYAEGFEFIKDNTIGIVIAQNEEAQKYLQSLRYGNYSVKRKLQKYTVSLRIYEFEEAQKLGILDDFGTGVFVLTNDAYYQKETGLHLDMVQDVILG